MSEDPCDFQTDPARAEIYQALSDADPAARTRQVLVMLESHAEGRLQLASCGEQRAMLDGIDLSPEHLRNHFHESGNHPAWWHADRQAIELRLAEFQGASLRDANFQRAMLEGANFAEADLASANLQGADLSGANLQGALLEDADLRKAILRFANGSKSVWEEAKLQGADLWGAEMEGADLSGADLQGAILEEANFKGADLAGADLRGADLKRTNLEGANLQGADLRGAALGYTNMRSAVLRDAKVQELDLTDCTLTHIHTSGTRLERTRLEQEQIGGAIGEELKGEYELARKGYLALERNFNELGDHVAASWAYRRRRRMEKRKALQQARTASKEGHWGEAGRSWLKYVGDQIIEWVCDYGESVTRSLGTLLVIYFLFIPVYGLTSTVVRVEQTGGETIKTPTRDLADLALFSLTAMTSPGNPPDYLLPRNPLAFLLAGVQTLLSIFLTGLMGFVAGNRIRR